MSTVQLRELGKIYPGGHIAVHDVDLAIADGEFFVLVGPSGCGKTSILRMIAGLEEISTGDVLVDGVSVKAIRTQNRNLAMLFQSSALYPHMTVGENLAFPLEMAHVGRRKVSAKVLETARVLGLEGCLDSMPGVLSGGERQRVAMGRAMIRQPDLMLMDEPMSNLDAKLRTELRAELRAMQRRLAATTVYVTHDQIEAMTLGDRVAVMRSGRIAQCAPPVELYRRPSDTYVAQFIGSPPMNLLGATVVRDSTGVGLQVGRHRISIDDVSWRWPGIDGLVDRGVIVGIRPEALRRDDAGEFELSVRFFEQVGTQQWIHCFIDAPVIDTTESDSAIEPIEPIEPTMVVALEGQGDVSLWKPLRLAVDHRQIHLFDRETGAALDRHPSGEWSGDEPQGSGSTVTGTPFNAMLPLTGS